MLSLNCGHPAALQGRLGAPDPGHAQQPLDVSFQHLKHATIYPPPPKVKNKGPAMPSLKSVMTLQRFRGDSEPRLLAMRNSRWMGGPTLPWNEQTPSSWTNTMKLWSHLAHSEAKVACCRVVWPGTACRALPFSSIWHALHNGGALSQEVAFRCSTPAGCEQWVPVFTCSVLCLRLLCSQAEP